MTATWVYMHLSSPAMREHYIRSLLAQYSSTYELSEADTKYQYLVHKLLIPREWLHAAVALQAKFQGDNLRQTMHLIKAGELNEAHEVLCRSVGPESIIARDYDALRELLGDFVQTPSNSPMEVDGPATNRRSSKRQKEPVPGWSRGGQIYFDYIHLLDLTKNLLSHRVDEEFRQDFHSSLFSLQAGLEGIARDKWSGYGLEERVALTEIAGAVAALVTKIGRASCRERVSRLV